MLKVSFSKVSFGGAKIQQYSLLQSILTFHQQRETKGKRRCVREREREYIYVRL